MPHQIGKQINNFTCDVEIRSNAGKYKPSWRQAGLDPRSRIALCLYFHDSNSSFHGDAPAGIPAFGWLYLYFFVFVF